MKRHGSALEDSWMRDITPLRPALHECKSVSEIVGGIELRSDDIFSCFIDVAKFSSAIYGRNSINEIICGVELRGADVLSGRRRCLLVYRRSWTA